MLPLPAEGEMQKLQRAVQNAQSEMKMEALDVAGFDPGERLETGVEVPNVGQVGSIRELFLAGVAPQQDPDKGLSRCWAPPWQKFHRSVPSPHSGWRNSGVPPCLPCDNSDSSEVSFKGTPGARGQATRPVPGELSSQGPQASCSLDNAAKVKEEETQDGEAADLESPPGCFRPVSSQEHQKMTGLLEEVAVASPKLEEPPSGTVKIQLYMKTLQKSDRKAILPAGNGQVSENEEENLPEQARLSGGLLEENRHRFPDLPMTQQGAGPGRKAREALLCTKGTDYARSFCESYDHLAYPKVDTGDKSYKCSFCGEDFKQRSYLVRHERTHTGEKPYKCSVCGKSFSQRSHIITHERTHTGEKPYRCSDCGKSFNRRANLMAHKRTHTGEKPYECSDCGKCFSQSSWLMAHKIIHTGEKPYKCSDCGKCFNHRSSLIKHERSHSEEKPYSCSDCGKSFNESSKLIKHQRIHTGEKPYKCLQCGKCFCFRSSLSQHERTHTGEKPYECCDCGKSFRQKSHLIRHERMHTGEKPYNCSDCTKSFSRSSALIEHKRIHTGEKPYKCSHCGKSFNQRSYSIIHERSHTGEKPYKCVDCGKSFNQRSHLAIHERTHPGEKPEHC